MSTAQSPNPSSREGTRAGGLARRGGGRTWFRPRSRQELRKGVWLTLALALLFVGSLGALWGAHAVARSDADRARLAFHLNSAEVASTLGLAIEHEEDLVVSGSAFVTGSRQTSAAGFDRWAQAVDAMKRYPELEDIGLVKLVPAARLGAFQSFMRANPLRPLGADTPGPTAEFQLLPPGARPYYCFAVAGLARAVASYIPGGVDYCAIAPALFATRDTGHASYAPFASGKTTTLGVETPVYRGGTVPGTVAARRHAFVGWLGVLLRPNVVLARALQGHPGLTVDFHYDAGASHVVFSSGRPAARAQHRLISLHNGWTVSSFGAALQPGILANFNSLALLLGGILLSLAFALLVFVLGTGRTRALTLVAEKTRELSHQAMHDALTGLPNRALVLDRAQLVLARTVREPGVVAGALFIDIDGFKHVNDNLGHAAGDELLKVVGRRLQDAVREQDTVGRLGGDEFVVLVECPSDEATLDILADRLTEALRQPVELEDGRTVFSVTASVGVAIGQYATPDDMLRDADLALYAAKAAGKDRYALFDAGMSSHLEGPIVLPDGLGTVDARELHSSENPHI